MPYDNIYWIQCRGVINGKADKAAALPKFSDMLTLSQRGGRGKLHPPIGFASHKIIRDYAPAVFNWALICKLESLVTELLFST